MNINPKTPEAYKLFHDGILALSRAEQHGIRVDMDYVEKQRKYLTRKITYQENEFFQSKFFKDWKRSSKTEVNIYSTPQLSHYVYNVLNLKPTKFTKSSTEENKKGAASEDALKELGIPELDNLIYIKKLKKIRDTYLESFAREAIDGVIHPFFNLHLVSTYRSSSDHPNFQNIPVRDPEANKVCRRALFARIGNQIFEIDFKGIEVAINACINQDPVLIKYVSDPKSDMHGDMAKQIYCIDTFDKNIKSHSTLRKAAKNGFVFPQFYGDYYKNNAISLACDWGKLKKGKWTPGMGLDMLGWEPPLHNFKLSDHLISKGIKNFNAFEEHVKGIEDHFWNNRFKVYKQWKERWFEQYKRNGFIDLKTGFRCSGVMSKNEVCNYPAQGAAFHCLLWSFVQLDKFIFKNKLKTRLMGQIHDSIIIDVYPPELQLITETVKKITTIDLRNHFDWIIVPLEIEAELTPIDGSWYQKEPYKL